MCSHLKPSQQPTNDDDHPTAEWADGTENMIMSVTMRDLQIEAAIKQQVRGPLWESTWKEWKICIAFRKDRSPLLALYMDRPGEIPIRSASSTWPN